MNQITEITRVDPFQAGIVLGVLYFLVGFVAMLFMIFFYIGFGGQEGTWFGGHFVMFLLPFLYGILGVVSGICIAGLYNVIVHFTGGIKMNLAFSNPSTEVASTPQQHI